MDLQSGISRNLTLPITFVRTRLHDRQQLQESVGQRAHSPLFLRGHPTDGNRFLLLGMIGDTAGLVVDSERAACVWRVVLPRGFGDYENLFIREDTAFIVRTGRTDVHHVKWDEPPGC